MAGSVPSVLVCGEQVGDDLRGVLEKAGYSVAFHDMKATGVADANGHHLFLVDSPGCAEAGLAWCRSLRAAMGESFVPILVVTEDDNKQRPAHLENGADSCLARPIDPAELLAQVHALLRIKERHDLWYTRSTEANRVSKRLQQAYQQIDQELELARRLQQSFLPQNLPQLPQVSFAVKYRSFGIVGGDFYDVFRLDENHLGFYVADAMGHGVPASLLTIFVKTAVKTKEIQEGKYRLVPPREVLQRLNRDLISQDLPDQPFVTMVYGLLDFRERNLSFSRSGHPYPLYIPREGPVEFWQIEGSLLGVFETTYPMHRHQLRPGDKVLLYTDGMEAAGFGEHPVGFASLLAGAAHFRDRPIQEVVERLSTELFGQTKQADDLTILGLEIR